MALLLVGFNLFGPNFAPTWDNKMFFQNCPQPQIRCLFPVEFVKKQFNSEESCRAHSESISCFSQEDNGSEILSYDYFNRTGCKYFFGSNAFHSGTDSPLSFEFETIELGWWVSGSCDCAHNATCTMPKLGSEKGFRCQCDEGYYGDGFKKGSGCRRGYTTGPPVFAVVLSGLLGFFVTFMILVAVGKSYQTYFSKFWARSNSYSKASYYATQKTRDVTEQK